MVSRLQRCSKTNIKPFGLFYVQSEYLFATVSFDLQCCSCGLVNTLLDPLAVDAGQCLLGRSSLLNGRACSDGLLPLKEPLQLRELLLGQFLVIVVLSQKEEAGQERSDRQIGKGELVTEEERTVAITLDTVGADEQLVDLLELDDEGLAVGGGLGGVGDEGCLVVSGLGACTPVVDQVAGLSALQWVLGEEAML